MKKKLKCFHYHQRGKCHVVKEFTDDGYAFIVYKYWLKHNQHFPHEIFSYIAFNIFIEGDKPLIKNIKFIT